MINITDLNFTSYEDLANSPRITVENCLFYSDSLRAEIIKLYILIIILLIYISIPYIKFYFYKYLKK